LVDKWNKFWKCLSLGLPVARAEKLCVCEGTGEHKQEGRSQAAVSYWLRLWEKRLFDALSSKGRVRGWILYEAGEMGIIKMKEYLIVMVKLWITICKLCRKIS
jgi:hypothetical protein